MGGGSYTSVPTILLKGKWLDQFGIKPGEYVEVEVNGDEIILRKTTPPEIKEKVSLEQKVRMLDKKQRAKLANLIDKL